ncbi:MAG: penicillin-binding protein 2 [Actinomycetota bacterium]
MLALFVVLMFAALTVRLWYLQVLASDDLVRDAQNNITRIVETDTIRGKILTSDGKVIVGNRGSIEIRVEEDKLGDNPEAVVSRLTRLLELKPSAIPEALADLRYYDYQPVPVDFDAPRRAVYYIAEHARRFPGVSWEEVKVRTYPMGDRAAHILGYTSPVYAEDLEANKGYDQNDVIGRGGLEQQYEKWLRGEEGFIKYEVNSAGRQTRTLGEKRSVPGKDLIISIDSELQAAAEEALDYGMEQAQNVFDEETNKNLLADAGAVVVMDPTTGAIEATVSRPSFDPAEFVGGISEKRFEALESKRRGQPIFNRVTQGEYAPGSAFKPFVALSAIRNGVASLGQSYDCPPTYSVPKDETTVFHNWSDVSLGFLDVAGSLRESCDTIYYDWGYQFYDRYYGTKDAKDPAEPLQRDLRQWGFERPTGIDLPTESVGNLPDDAWIEGLYEVGEANFDFNIPGDYIQMAIGQGGVLGTPLQLATAYSMLANGGKCVVPHIGTEIRDPNREDKPKALQPRCKNSRTPLPYSQSDLQYIRDALVDVIREGTAQTAFAGFGGSIAGKTGTSQREGEQDFSWFAAMTPAEQPEHVVVVVVEHGGNGSETAAPIARRIVEHIEGIESDDFIIGEAID